MPPEIKTDRSAIINGAIAVIEERGAAALSARTVADKLGISTQPIYREFADMGEVRKAATARGFEIFAEFVAGGAEEQAARYVTFAVERKNLFNFLFRDRNCEYADLDDMAHRLVDGTEIIDKLADITGLPRDRVYRLHFCLWMALHGLACMVADNKVEKLGSDDISKLTVEMTRALTMFYGKEQQ